MSPTVWDRWKTDWARRRCPFFATCFATRVGALGAWMHACECWARGVVAKMKCGIRQTQRGRRRVCDDREREPTVGGDELSLPRNCCWKAKKKLQTSPRFQPPSRSLSFVLLPIHHPRLCVRWASSRVAESSDQLPSHVPVHNRPPSPLGRACVHGQRTCVLYLSRIL